MYKSDCFYVQILPSNNIHAHKHNSRKQFIIFIKYIKNVKFIKHFVYRSDLRLLQGHTHATSPFRGTVLHVHLFQ